MPLVTASSTKQQSHSRRAESKRGVGDELPVREAAAMTEHITHTHTRFFCLPSIGLLFGCVEGDAALLLVTRKLAGSVSDAPKDIPLMSLGLNFFLHEGARRKFLSSSLKKREKVERDEERKHNISRT